MWISSLYSTTRVTAELREIVKSVNIWDFDYPSYYKGDAKKAFEQKVIDHYYLRQIGQETVGRFLHMFHTRIREIMPYYIELYKSVEIMNGIEDPFGNVDIVETFEQSSSAEAKGSSESTGKEETKSSSTGSLDKEHRFSNTPQGTLDDIDEHMSEGSKDHEEQTSSGSGSTSQNAQGSTNSESSEKVKHTLTRKGNQGVNTYAHDMKEFRTAIIDVDMMIIENLNDLFLGIY